MSGEVDTSQLVKGLFKAGKEAVSQKSREALDYLKKPENIAEVVIAATSAQEKVNSYLEDKNSAYRIGEVQITAGLPPQVSFSVVRGTKGLDSSTLLGD